MGKYWFHLQKIKKKIAFFHVLGNIIPTTCLERKKKIRLSRGVFTAAAVDKKLSRRFFSRLKR
jgi:hypothetical protein